MTDYIDGTNYPVHPSEILKDIVEDRELTQKTLADKLGISTKHMSELIAGQVSFTPTMALKLEFVLGTPAQTWLKLQSNHDIIKSRLEIKEQVEQQFSAEKTLLKQFRNCYSNLQEWGFVKKTSVQKERYLNILEFFNVPSLQLLTNNYNLAKFRKGKSEPDAYTVAAWMRVGERQFEINKPTIEFSVSRFKDSLRQIRELTNLPITEATKKLVDICAESGVSVVFTPYFSNTHINGSTRWIVSSRPLIQLTERNKRSDTLWFTFFHEAAHILLHSKKQNYISWDSEENNSKDEESAADLYARDFLISPKQYEAFLVAGDYSHPSIKRFSQELGIGADILAGRLAYEGVIGWNVASPLFKSIKLEKA